MGGMREVGQRGRRGSEEYKIFVESIVVVLRIRSATIESRYLGSQRWGGRRVPLYKNLVGEVMTDTWEYSVLAYV